jgi:ribonuclease HII
MKSRWYYEDQAEERGYARICGVDEAGRGSLAGPVVAAAVMLDRRKSWKGIRDSKLLPPHARKKFFKKIVKESFGWGVGVTDARQIDDMNILNATMLAMKRAILSLEKKPHFILIDAVDLSDLPYPSLSIVRGDQLSYSIAAASIIAKVYRDALMMRLHDHFPQYNFLQNKGYGTSEHRKALKCYGPCEMHRYSFRSVLGQTVNDG